MLLPPKDRSILGSTGKDGGKSAPCGGGGMRLDGKVAAFAGERINVIIADLRGAGAVKWR